jgi:hypothetical protein
MGIQAVAAHTVNVSGISTIVFHNGVCPYRSVQLQRPVTHPVSVRSSPTVGCVDGGHRDLTASLARDMDSRRCSDSSADHLGTRGQARMQNDFIENQSRHAAFVCSCCNLWAAIYRR